MDITYSVKRSSKRTKVTITIERDSKVVVHAPNHASDEEIARIVEAKRHWIYEKTRHSLKYTGRPHPPGKELVNGESALYLGRSYRIEVVDKETECIRFDQRFLIPASRAPHKKDAMREWYIARAKERILPRVVKQARELGGAHLIVDTEASIAAPIGMNGSPRMNDTTQTYPVLYEGYPPAIALGCAPDSLRGWCRQSERDERAHQ